MDSVSPYQSSLANAYQIPVRIFANKQVPIEHSALSELQQLLDLQATVEQLQTQIPDFFASPAALKEVAITPDFHKAKGIPVGSVLRTQGFILPQAIGKDINCGMRLLLTDLPEDKLLAQLENLKPRLRHLYFQGGRALPLSPLQRKAILQEGLIGLLETQDQTKGQGLWAYYDAAQQEADIQCVMDQGSMPAQGIFEGLHNYTKLDYTAYDSQLGSIGGGNHFVELQRIEKIHDAATAHAWGLKPGRICIMIHSGSLSVGYPAAGYFSEILKSLYPKNLKYPANGIFPLPLSARYASYWAQFEMALHNAANFAFANRLFLGLIMQRALSETLGNVDARLVYDSGHNMLWREGQSDYFIHRKGACSARGPEQMQNTPFAWTGEPVLIPGSMGAASYLMAGQGAAESLYSSSHGAGRSLSRGASLKVDDALFEDFMRKFHIVTPIDPNAPQVRGRRDILQKWKDEIKQEAPFAFKEIGPVIDTQVQANMLRTVAEMRPILTVKG